MKSLLVHSFRSITIYHYRLSTLSSICADVRVKEVVRNGPVVISDHQQDVLSQGSQVLSLVVNVGGIVRDLKHQPLPVMNLLEHLQQPSDKQRNIIMMLLHIYATQQQLSLNLHGIFDQFFKIIIAFITTKTSSLSL